VRRIQRSRDSVVRGVRERAAVGAGSSSSTVSRRAETIDHIDCARLVSPT
jgi:hypothetical protein